MVTESVRAAPREENNQQPRRARQWGYALLGLLTAWAYYAKLLSFGRSGFFGPVPHGLSFNSMLTHGLFRRCLRLPFLLLPDFASTDFTRLSCLVAVTTMASFKTASTLTVLLRNN